MRNNILFAIISLLSLFVNSTYATPINFDSLQDGSNVTNQYILEGVTFRNAVALTAGFSLNEIDFPPHSGSVAVGDNGLSALEIQFSKPTSQVSAWFTYGSPLSLHGYDSNNASLINITLPGTSNFGESFFVDFGPIALSRISFDAGILGTTIFDDLSFTQDVGPAPPPNNQVPEPPILLLFLVSIASLIIYQKKYL